MRTDTELLDWLEEVHQTSKYGKYAIFRFAGQNGSWKLHEDKGGVKVLPGAGPMALTVREALDKSIDKFTDEVGNICRPKTREAHPWSKPPSRHDKNEASTSCQIEKMPKGQPWLDERLALVTEAGEQ